MSRFQTDIEAVVDVVVNVVAIDQENVELQVVVLGDDPSEPTRSRLRAGDTMRITAVVGTHLDSDHVKR